MRPAVTLLAFTFLFSLAACEDLRPSDNPRVYLEDGSSRVMTDEEVEGTWSLDDPDAEQHLDTLRARAERGDRDARFWHVFMTDLEQERYAKGYAKLEALAKEGHALAADYLGHVYGMGRGVAVDMEQAIHWKEVAARLGHEDAQRELAYYRAHHVPE